MGSETVQAPGHAAAWTRHLAPNYATPRLLFVRGEGPWLETADGTRYLDLLGGLAVNALGHCHPHVVGAVQEQAARLAHVSNLYATAPVLRLAERLAGLVPDRVAFFANSGAEANEAALKLVRRHAHATARPDGVVVAFTGSFHGRTMGTVTLTGQAAHQEGFAPLLPNVVHVPFNDVAALERVFADRPVVGLFMESVQGEGGVVPMSADCAAAIARLSSAHDALVVADEVQTGLGRTGRLFGYQHLGLDPDVVTLAKALGGGYPIGVALLRRDLAPLLSPGSHGTTFGGNPVSCAAANAVLDVFAAEGLVARAADLGARLTAALRAALGSSDVTVRGHGLLVGLALPRDVAPEVVRALEAEHVLVGQAGKRVVRLAPPLNIDADLLLDAVPRIAAAARAALAPA